ncbi:MAG: ABC transporter ATP-binding protein [Mesorhizobium sp.]|uniref:ABC transporter ATP-binding protein n=1 Tax=Mesorhizobium sp. TaxID=1871066 RepID=UPI000FE40A6B|nr:ABC transporter ATP-binding protein [Mesorhizobium sp.]RWN61278.1 MAG: ABC transporter ATP-binding protein [Mesorhizobium sp.]RWO33363.1 MAG: ABC transporter ATP-binding protein [Mesorhizobium sp.]RWO46203.1 MAG: ABC transporter ATP-binding protein [Mesorhizobium sp.]TIN80491.1 MAG: ATP-binding cassette domain-containing protein [Mesorhizobium sp.]
MSAKRRISAALAYPLVKRLILENLPPHIKLYLAGLLCTIAGAAATSGFAWIMRDMINSIYIDRNAAAVWGISAAIIGLSAVKGIAAYGQTITTGNVRRAIVSDLQHRQFSRLMRLDIGHFVNQHPAKFISKIMFNARAGASVIITLTSNTASDVLTLVGLASVMVVQDPTMSLISAAALPVIFLSVSTITRKIKSLARGETELAAQVQSIGTEAIDGIRTIKSFQLEDKAIASFAKAVRKMERRGVQINRTSALMSPLMETGGGFIIGLFLIYASWQTLGNGKTPGEFMAFITAFLLAYEPAKRLARVNVDIQKLMVAVEQMYDLIDTPEQRQLATAGERLTGVEGGIRFEDVAFSYGGNSPALHGVSFEVRPREKLAIVGRSGAGKTTIVNLILRLMEPDRGRIFIDDKDIAKISLADVRDNIALVSQDIFLFEGSIRDNIRDGRPNATDQEIDSAAELARVTSFASNLENGLDTLVGPGGANLSGGQKQRVAIARALLKNAPVIVYDEATSALDGENERAVMEAAFDDAFQRTVICIAHRLSTIKAADRILVFDAGILADSGTHEELASRSEIYRSIFHLETSAPPVESGKKLRQSVLR